MRGEAEEGYAGIVYALMGEGREGKQAGRVGFVSF